MTFGSLFSGIGGFDLGLERAGMRCLWQVEIDRKCSELLQQRWPTVERHADVRAVGTSLARVDLICGGFPCQDLSVAGQRAGLDGARSGLWFEFHRILAELAPGWCLIENVPGLLSSNRGRDFLTLVRGLAELGYRVSWRVLDAQFAGLAQRRKRVFVVGSLGDGRSANVLFEPESVRWHPAPRRAPRQRAANALGERPDRGGGNSEGQRLIAPALAASGRGTERAGESRGQDPIVATLRVGGRERGAGSSSDNTPIVAGVVRSNMRNNSDPSTEAAALVPFSFAENQRAEVRESDITPQLSVGGGKPGSGHPAIAWGLQERDAKGADSNTKEGHLIVADPVKVREFDASNNAGRLHNVVTGMRRLTPRECERLQGFPDDWTAGFSDSKRYRMLGNAVAVPVAEWIGRRLETVSNG